jgi:hypothetical protein
LKPVRRVRCARSARHPRAAEPILDTVYAKKAYR